MRRLTKQDLHRADEVKKTWSKVQVEVSNRQWNGKGKVAGESRNLKGRQVIRSRAKVSAIENLVKKRIKGVVYILSNQ